MLKLLTDVTGSYGHRCQTINFCSNEDLIQSSTVILNLIGRKLDTTPIPCGDINQVKHLRDILCGNKK